MGYVHPSQGPRWKSAWTTAGDSSLLGSQLKAGGFQGDWRERSQSLLCLEGEGLMAPKERKGKRVRMALVLCEISSDCRLSPGVGDEIEVPHGPERMERGFGS